MCTVVWVIVCAGVCVVGGVMHVCVDNVDGGVVCVRFARGMCNAHVWHVCVVCGVCTMCVDCVYIM